jgi:UDPglucose 6-dehydrogenase
MYSVVGLGKLGASMAAAVASRGFDVIGVDLSREAIDLLNEGTAPVPETNLQETISANRDRLRATSSFVAAVSGSDVTFVIVPTPSDDRGAFSLRYAARAFGKLGRALAKKDGYHLVVLTSTVLPGSLRYVLLPIIERKSGKVCGRDFGLCYSPEFIALGSVIHDFLNPDFTLVGEFDERSGSLLEECYLEILENGAPCKRMSIENAELAKVALNSFVTTKITYANMLMEMCERIPGGNIDVVTDALGADRRIGKHYFKGGLGYGGPCFPRDNVALGFMARALGCNAELAEATDRLNRGLPERTAEKLIALIKPGETAAVLGLAYKPNSHVVEESQGLYLARALSRAGVKVLGHDPLAGAAAAKELSDRLVIIDSLHECIGRADFVIVATPDPAFSKLKAEDFTCVPVTVVDFWRILSTELTDRPGIRYIPAGFSRNESQAADRLIQLWDSGA